MTYTASFNSLCKFKQLKDHQPTDRFEACKQGTLVYKVLKTNGQMDGIDIADFVLTFMASKGFLPTD